MTQVIKDGRHKGIKLPIWDVHQVISDTSDVPLTENTGWICSPFWYPSPKFWVLAHGLLAQTALNNHTQHCWILGFYIYILYELQWWSCTIFTGLERATKQKDTECVIICHIPLSPTSAHSPTTVPTHSSKTAALIMTTLPHSFVGVSKHKTYCTVVDSTHNIIHWQLRNI